MARRTTVVKVHEAIVSLAREQSVAAITMEGVAERAGVSKQTLYRTWPSTGSILCDALLARSTDGNGAVVLPDSGDLYQDLRSLGFAMVDELLDPNQGPLLRAVTAEMLSDAHLADQVRDGLLLPQLRAIAQRFHEAGVLNPEDAAELFVGPVFHRWLLGTRQFESRWMDAHAARVVRAVAPSHA